MPRSTKDSDEDTEMKAVRRIRMLTTHNVPDSPVRRSSRIKQPAKQNKSSPESPVSDTSSISNSQPTRVTRQRTATIDYNMETSKGRHTRKTSDTSDMIDTDVTVGTPKRVTRSLAATIGTPTKITRAVSKRLMRAGSETKSPMPVVRLIRTTRASSAEPGKNISQPGTPTKMRRRASVLPSRSPVKEEIEEQNNVSYIDNVLIKIDESISLGNQELDEIKCKSQDTLGEVNSNDEMVSLSALSTSGETLSLLEDVEKMQKKHVNKITLDEKDNLAEEQQEIFSDVATVNETSMHNTSNIQQTSISSKSKVIEREESLTEIEQSILDICKNSSEKKLQHKIGHLSNSSAEESDKSPNNKENQTLSINSVITPGKSVDAVNVTSLSSKSPTSIFMNKSLNEKENKLTRNESFSGKRRCSRDSTEVTTKCHSLSKEITNTTQEMNTSSSTNETYLKDDLDSSSLNVTNTEQGLAYKIDNETIATDDMSKSVFSQNKNLELVEHTIDKNISNENMSKFDENLKESDENAAEQDSKRNKIDKARNNIDNEISNKIILDETNKFLHSQRDEFIAQEENSDEESGNYSLTIDNTDMRVVLEEQNVHQDRNEILDKLTEAVTYSGNSVDSANDIKMSRINKEKSEQSIVFDKQSLIKDNAIDNLSNSIKQKTKNLFKHVTESVTGHPDTIVETVNSAVKSTNVDNTVIQDKSVLNEILGKSTMNVSPKKAKFRNTLETTVTSKRKSIDESSLENNEKKKDLKTNKKNQKSIEITDSDSELNGIKVENLFQDISAAEWKKKTVKLDNDAGNSSMHSKLMENEENENETECNLILVDKQAWLAAESIRTKEKKRKESLEYDSDDTVLLESAILASNNTKKISTIKKKLQIDIDAEKDKMDILVKTKKSSTKRKSNSKYSSNEYLENTHDSSSNISSDNYIEFLNQSTDYHFSKLNKSGKEIKEVERSFRVRDASEEEMQNDADKLCASSQVEKKNTSLRKSAERRKSLNKSLKDTSLKHSILNAQDTSVDKFRAEYIDNEINNANIHTEQKSKKKRSSMNKHQIRDDEDANNDITESRNNENLSSSTCHSIDKNSKSINTIPSIQFNMEDSSESDDSKEIIIPAKDSGIKNNRNSENFINYSTIAHAGSDSERLSDNNTSEVHNSSNTSIENDIPGFLFANSDDDDDDDDDDNGNDEDENDDDDDDNNSIDSDIKKEYNLDGVKRKFPDDNLPGDECRGSELEFSDPEDNGSDLADFIVDDDEIQAEEEEESNEDQDEQNAEEDKVINEDDEQEDIECEIEDDKEDIKKGNNIADNDKYAKKEEFSEAETVVNIKNTVHQMYDPSKYTNELSKNQKNKVKDVKIRKSHMERNKENSSLDASNPSSPSKKKKKSDLSFSKNITEQNSVEMLNDSETIFTKKFPKLDMSMEYSTPKLSSHNRKCIINVETLETASENETNKSNNTDQKVQTSSLKKKKSKTDSMLKKDINLRELNYTTNIEEKLMHSSLPSDLLDAAAKLTPSKLLFSKTGNLRQTMNIIHTETPTIRHLMKEKLNESAPTLKLGEGTNRIKKRRLSHKEKNNIIQMEIAKEDNKEEELPNLIIPANNDAVQEHNRRKRKKHKKHVKATLKKSISEECPVSDMIKSDDHKNRKHLHPSRLSPRENIAFEDTHQSKEKRNKKKRTQIDVTKIAENVKEDNIAQNYICKDKMELSQHNKKKNKDKIVNSVEDDNSLENLVVKKKIKQQKVMENTELSLNERPQKKKKKEKSLLLQTTSLISKSRHDKIPKKLQMRDIVSDTIESKNIAFSEAQKQALAAIKDATESIKISKKLKKRNKPDSENMIQEQNVKIPIKQQKKKIAEEKNKNKSLSSTSGLKRLSDDVIENLSDVPMRLKKKRKIQRDGEQSMSSLTTKKPEFIDSKSTNKSSSNFIALSSCGSTTQFAVVNLKKTKKQPLEMTTTAASFRQRMLSRNNRHPVSAYLMYLGKQRATANNQFVNNLV